jgi:hypothetical protein
MVLWPWLPGAVGLAIGALVVPGSLWLAAFLYGPVVAGYAFEHRRFKRRAA